MPIQGYKSNNPDKPDVDWWLQQIRFGIKYRQDASYEQKWKQWRNYYRGNWRGDIMPSNIFFKMIRTIVPRIYFRNPSVSVVSKRPGVEGFVLAKLLERTDNKLINQMQLKKHLKRQVQETFVHGSGIGKLGFGSQFHAVPEQVGTTEAPLVNLDRETVEYNFDMMPNMPWYAKWPLNGYVLPAGTVWREDARWECFITRRPLDDVKADTRLDKRISSKIKGNPRDLRNTSFNRDDLAPVEMVDLYEIRDKKTGRVFIISPTFTDAPLTIQQDGYLNMGIEVGNLTIFNEDDECVWGIPDSQILEPLQRELNEIRTVKMYHRRLSVVKMLVRRGAILQEEVDKMLNSDILSVIWTEEDPDQAMKIIEAANIPQAQMMQDMEVMNDVRETLGMSRNEFGEFQGGRESPTATETQIVKAASEIRVEERRDMMADLLVSLTKDINKLIFKHWQREQVEEVVGPGGVPMWVEFTPTMLKRGVYDIAVDPDQAVPQTKELREQKALIMYERLKQNPLIDPYKLTQYLLHELHGVAFDDMMAGLPPGMGLTQEQPLSVGQFGQVVQNVQKRAPQMLEQQA
jgi:hypothetical protein